MNRLWLTVGGLLIVTAAIFGWLTANSEGELVRLPVLADATKPGCDAPGQLWLTLGNASGRTVMSANGVISVSRAAGDTPVAVGNFTLEGPLLHGSQEQFCAAIEEPDLGGINRRDAWWLARATAVEFGDADESDASR